MTVLRLSIAAYKLLRTITVNGICSTLSLPGRGITAGAVHVTVELRFLLIQWMDETVALFPSLLSVMLYVDDVSLESLGTQRTVAASVTGAARVFTRALEAVGMELVPRGTSLWRRSRPLLTV